VSVVTLSEAQLDQLADRIADRLRASSPPVHRLVDAQRLADALGVRRATVYEHADELGAIRLGGGSKPRLRFDLEKAQEAFACYASKRSQGSNASAGAESDDPGKRRRGRLPNHLPEPGSVLAVRPQRTA
jgi:hypothetical protein